MGETWQDMSVLVAGCGSIGKRHARVLSGLGVTDIRVCDPVEAQRAGLQQETPDVRVFADYAEALADGPDAVFICTPPSQHVPMSVQAIEAGCHVFTEKPLSHDTDGVDGLARIIGTSGRTFMVGLCFRYHEGLLRAKRALGAGRIGRLISIRALMGEHLPEVRPDYRNLFVLKSMGALDLMHDIDLALWFADQPVADVKCVAGAFSDLGFEAPDVVELALAFEDRCVASVHLDFFQRPRRRQLELIGTEGCLIVEFASWDRCMVSTYEASKGAWEIETLSTDRDDMFRAEDTEFLVAAANGDAVTCPLSEGLKSVEVVEAARRNS